jgi:FtsZ-binding cell division protein ZapB
MEQASVEIEGLEPLARLEERILETVEQLRVERREKEEARREAALLRERLQGSEQRARQLTAEVEALRRERRLVAERVEKLLAQVDSLRQG